jgi:pectin methylesterase-like acyl-CoA thioesterase
LLIPSNKKLATKRHRNRKKKKEIKVTQRSRRSAVNKELKEETKMTGIRNPKIWLAMTFVLLHTAFIAAATERHVPSQYPTIQAAIDAAVNGDTVIVAPGTYTGAGNRDIDFKGKAITVRSIDPNDPNVVGTTVIDCNGTTGDYHRGFYFHNSEGPNSILAGLTITNGVTLSGGAIKFESSSPLVKNCVLKNNYAYGDYDEEHSGGAFICVNSSPVVSQCVISGNTAKYQGNQVYCKSGNAVIEKCTIIGLEIEIFGGNPNIRGCLFLSTNTAIDITSYSIVYCIIENNIIMSDYMGIYLFENDYGGMKGIIRNNVLAGSGIREGYGIFYRATHSNPTVTGNIITDWENGIDFTYNSIESERKAKITYNNLWNNTINYVSQSASFDLTGLQGNISANPLFVDPNDNDYHLLPDSPCINAGDPNYVSGPNETDMDGEPRVINGRVDIGADEFNYEGPVLGISPRKFDFYCLEGGPNPEVQVLTIHIRGTDSLNWNVTEDCFWLQANPTAGNSAGEVDEVALSVDANGFETGEYSCILTVSSPDAINTPQCVTVNLHVKKPLIGINPTEFEFSCAVGNPNPESQILSIRNASIGILNWQITEDCSWLEASPTTGSSTGDIDKVILTLDVAGLPCGHYTCDLTISDDAAGNSPVIVPVTLIIYPERHVPADFSTIQAAIDNANNGDTIIVDDGIYTGNGNCDIDFRGKAITVCSENGPENCIIDCNGTEGKLHTGFIFRSGEDVNAVLDGFTITNGYATDGGGIFCMHHSSPTITNCTISGNKSKGSGGGVCCMEGSNPTISNCSVIGNSSERDGGGISCMMSSSSPTITNCTISGNKSKYNGGGVFCMERSNPTISNCSITGNSSERDGGGIFCMQHSSPTITNCTISGNTSKYNGSGVFCMDYSNPAIIDCTITGNSSEREGGGICCMFHSSPTITNCIISGNKSKGSGGGMCNNFNSSPTVTNCTFSANSASYRGGMYNFASSPMVTNCILWADTPEEIYTYSGTPTVTYSDVQGGYTGVGNINADPCFVNPDSNDFHLLPDSLCINAGDPNFIAEPNETDIDGEQRVMFARVDMGSDEFNPIRLGIVSKKRVSRTEFAYDCNATFTNLWPFAVKNVELEMIEVPENMTIIEPNVTFGDIEFGTRQSITSIDTCTFQVDRSKAIEPDKIVWRVKCQMADTGMPIELTCAGALADDGKIGFEDLAELAGQWLKADGDGVVNFIDFARIAEKWQGQ